MVYPMEFMWQRSARRLRSSNPTSSSWDSQSHERSNSASAEIDTDAFDIEAVEKAIVKSAQRLNTQSLHEILDGAFKNLTTEEEARKYLLGPLNHTGSSLPNDKTRHIIQNCAKVICLNGPPGVRYKQIRNPLTLNLNLYCVSLDTAYNEEITDPDSMYPDYLKSATINTFRIPDKMKVELLGKYLERRILEGQTRFLVDGFPNTGRLAALFEEDVCLIQAYIVVDGPTTKQAEYSKFIEANRSVREKLDADGRFFKLNLDQSPREVDADTAEIENTINSIKYMATVMGAGDVFRPPPPHQEVRR
ncbi:MAG: hypothetical protein Q9216_003428 [Gyalolechia sp. 2 TL-2023]